MISKNKMSILLLQFCTPIPNFYDYDGNYLLNNIKLIFFKILISHYHLGIMYKVIYSIDESVSRIGESDHSVRKMLF